MNIFSKLKKSMKEPENVNIAILVFAFIFVFVVLTLALGKLFLSKANFASMAGQIPEFGFLAFAISLCMVSGGTDLSIVATANLTTIISSSTILALSEKGMAPVSAIIIGFAIGLVGAVICGIVNGFLIIRFRINSLLSTMATMMLYNGISTAVTTGKTITGLPVEFSDIGLFKILGLPFAFFLLMFVALILIFILSRTMYGKNLYLHGANHTVALFSGMKVGRLIMTTYMLDGLLAGIGGLLMLCRVSSAQVGYGDTYLLQAILVCALGGVSALGGRGRLFGVVLAICVLQMLQSGFTLLGFESYYKNFIWGTVLIVVLIINFYIDKRSKKSIFKVENAGKTMRDGMISENLSE